MANNKGTSELPSFTSLKGHERRAVILRAGGKTFAQITAHINNEFALEYAEITVQEWFYAGGRLEQAYSEYLEADAVMSLKEARQIIKRSSKAAVDVLVDQLKSGKEENIRQGAAKSLLNKYIPDKQQVLDSSYAEEDLPEELAAIADSLKEGSDGSQPVDDPGVGDQDSEKAGAGQS